jgi:malonyl-CoA O-methyltransferase
LRDRFDGLAGRYDLHAALEREVCRRLLERTEFRRREPARILDIGCGTGFGSAQLKRSFRKAQVIGIDTSTAMLNGLKRRSGLLRPLQGVCADMAAPPFPDHSVDLVFANLSIHWCPRLPEVLAGLRRVLKPGGLMLFSTLGPASFSEFRAAWEAFGTDPAMVTLPDLMALGDALVAAGFGEPVMDAETITLEYPSLAAMKSELEATGVSLLWGSWDDWPQLESELMASCQRSARDGKFGVGFEIIYGTAFGPAEGQPRKTPQGDVATFSVGSLLQSRDRRD